MEIPVKTLDEIQQIVIDLEVVNDIKVKLYDKQGWNVTSIPVKNKESAIALTNQLLKEIENEIKGISAGNSR